MLSGTKVSGTNVSGTYVGGIKVMQPLQYIEYYTYIDDAFFDLPKIVIPERVCAHDTSVVRPGSNESSGGGENWLHRSVPILRSCLCWRSGLPEPGTELSEAQG